MSTNLTTTQTKHKPLKLLKIKKGPIDKTIKKITGTAGKTCKFEAK